jgi:radical SAM protein with 4Fe4S-binding SPASM domain
MTNTNEVRIENSTRCNYCCKFCPHGSSSFTRTKEVMELDTFKFILDKIKKEAPYITECTVSGFGEPTVDFSLMDKIQYAIENQYRVHFVTNGSLLHKDTIEHLFELKINDIRISYHATDLNSYNEVTGVDCEGCFLHATKTIKSAIELKKQFPDTNVIITMDVIKENEHCVDEMIQLYSEQVDLLEIWKPHNWTNWGSYRKGKIIKSTCGRLINGPLQIQVDGTINVCCFDFNGELVIGNFLKQSLEEIFKSELYDQILKAHSSEEEMQKSNLICKKCDQLRDTGSIIVYNSKYSESQRVGKTSTNYRSIE